MIRTLDDFFFDRFPAFQKITNAVDYLTGITHSTLATFCVIVGTAYTGAKGWQLVAFDQDPNGWRILLLQGVLVILFLAQTQLHEHHTRKNDHFRNPLRLNVSFVIVRLLFVATAIWGLTTGYLAGDTWWLAVGGASVTCGYYFLACDRLPPGDRFFDRFRKRALA